jgi:SAM-dependent methyltransferase
VISEIIEQHAQMRAGAKLLDFGCGNGAALRTFSKRHPDWWLYGSELSDAARPALQALSNFVELFVGPPEKIAARFDLITMIHSLEHVISPVETLEKLGARLNVSGRILVEVPDCAATPYDLVIADHLTHFSLSALQLAGARAGFLTIHAADSSLPKELTWIGGRSSGQSPSICIDARSGIERTLTQIAWLGAQIEEARRIASAGRQFGIFGTSISATWLAGAVDDSVAFFVDEDEGRIGREHIGRPILSPRAAPIDSDVYVPLIPRTARQVCDRHNGSGARFHPAPALA